MRAMIYETDPYLKPYRKIIDDRKELIASKKAELVADQKNLSEFANGYAYFGLHKTADGWVLRERAPNADGIWLVNERTGWKPIDGFSFHSVGGGVWQLNLDQEQLVPSELYKLWVTWKGGADYRLPIWCNRVVQDDATKLFNAQVYVPKLKVNKTPLPEISHPYIYEAHVGMSSEDPRVNSFNEFTNSIIPRVKELGYNTIQLMAVQEHPYYGSFGYHVANFFAVSSRFGTPDELRNLINTAHSFGLRVIMDIVHSHAVKNVLEGPGLFDGTGSMLFHTDHRREHPAWDSLCFDYGKNEVLHFLLSNCKYWIEEYGFDGFRFDGVTSMLYFDHGLGKAFTSYDDYFNPGVDPDALIYLGLANSLIHEINPGAISIAEDMSGMPGIASALDAGGLGFDYRLAMGVPDFWIKLLKERRDEEWNVNHIYWELTNRRPDEKTISYAESHDQALVGDKTIIFWLADKEMYTHMSKSSSSLIIDRAIALHKIIRLLTFSTHGGGYLNFMGNEFGHPEWIDFPREGNNWSYHYARRQWNLAENDALRYSSLNQFDKEMIRIGADYRADFSEEPQKILGNEADQVLVYKRGSLWFVYNLNPVKAFQQYGIPANPADYKIILSTDEIRFNGFGNIDTQMVYEAMPLGPIGSGYQLYLYLPPRTSLVMLEVPIKPIRTSN